VNDWGSLGVAGRRTRKALEQSLLLFAFVALLTAVAVLAASAGTLQEPYAARYQGFVRTSPGYQTSTHRLKRNVIWLVLEESISSDRSQGRGP